MAMRSAFLVISAVAAVQAQQESSSTSIIHRLEELERKYLSCSEKLEQETSRREQETAKIHEQLNALRSRLKDDPAQIAMVTAADEERHTVTNAHRRLSRKTTSARVEFDGVRLNVNTPMNITHVTATGTVTSDTLTDGTATISGGALASATTVTASGAITGGSLTDGTATISGGVIASATTVTASGAISGGTMSSTGDVNIGGDLTLSGNIFRTGAVAFSAYSSAWNSAEGAIVPFDVLSVNEGLSFNTATYTFTAPVKGIYYIASHAAANGYTTDMCAYVNDIKIDPCATGGAAWDGIALSMIRELPAGSTVSIKSLTGYIQITPQVTCTSAGFSGFLITATT